jgi:hypothetical protein
MGYAFIRAEYAQEYERRERRTRIVTRIVNYSALGTLGLIGIVSSALLVVFLVQVFTGGLSC